VDALLAALDGLVAKKEAVKRGVMEEVLGSASQLKVESAGCTIDDIVIKILGGGTPSRGIESYWNGRIPWMTVKDFTSFDPLATEEYITSEGLANSSTNIIESGTLILATRIALGKCQIYAVDVAINQDLKAIYFASDVYPKFMYYWFIFQENIIESLGSGSTVKGISLTDLRSLPICLPSYTEQRAIATLLSDLDAELAALRARREKLTRVKAGMMGELLTGRVRLV
jgi:type I restriction enzyme S subunit